jgi:RimJ/RimL family protein N-acetyltransferase
MPRIATRVPTAPSRRRLTRLRKKMRPEVLYNYSFPVPSEKQWPGSESVLAEADAAGLKQLRSTYPRQLSAEKYQLLVDRLSSPDERCWLILDDTGQPCGYCHMTLESTLNARINYPVRLAPHQLYFFDDYIVRQHRGKGLHTLAIARRMELAAEEGITKGVITISRKNLASISSFTKFGVRREGTLVYLPFLRRTLPLPFPRRSAK